MNHQTHSRVANSTSSTFLHGSLALVSLDWMMAKAYDSGLRFDQGSVAAVRSEMNWLGPMHDSRRLAGFFYRYGPRKVEEIMESLKALRVHASAPTNPRKHPSCPLKPTHPRSLPVPTTLARISQQA